jgi:hypothetical protein
VILDATVLGEIVMHDAMSDAEIGCCEVELLPARTVLSMRSAGIQGVLGGNDSGTSGGPGNHDGASHPHNINLLWWLNQPGTANSDTAAAGSTAPGTVSHISGSEFGSDGANANGRRG